MAYKFDVPILASNVKWDDKTGEGPKDKNDPSWSLKSRKERNRKNGTEEETFEFGTLEKRVYLFAVNKDINGKSMIADNHYISLPCPDFCGAKLNSKEKIVRTVKTIKSK